MKFELNISKCYKLNHKRGKFLLNLINKYSVNHLLKLINCHYK